MRNRLVKREPACDMVASSGITALRGPNRALQEIRSCSSGGLGGEAARIVHAEGDDVSSDAA